MFCAKFDQTSLVKDVFVTGKIQPVLPPISLPSTIGTPGNVTTWIIDTSAGVQERNALRLELRKCNVILLVYSDHYSYERVALFWLPHFRSLGINVPVVLCANKSDLAGATVTASIVEEEMLPVMNEFKEIDSCIRTSAREHANVNEVFYLCQKAVTHPIAPIYDAKESCLKPAAILALRRIFYLCDTDQDGLLNDAELFAIQLECFDKPLAEEDLINLKQSIARWSHADTDKGIDVDGFLLLNKMFVEKGRHETVWLILRKYHYTDSLSLKDSYLHPKFEVPRYASAELSPAGYHFLVDLFVAHDRDKDGVLDDDELATAFAPTPGVPTAWLDSSFPSSTVCNEAGHVTLQGWIAQWSMTTFEHPKVTLEYLAYLGFDSINKGGTIAGLKLTKTRKHRNRAGKVERNVFLCYVLGARGCGKSSLLSAFLNRPLESRYAPTLKPRTAVNGVELENGKQCYLILQELGETEATVIQNQVKLDACDLLCYTYDSSDPDSFGHIVDQRKSHPQLCSLPTVYVALKADCDRAMQRTELQPEQYTDGLQVPKPLHTSVSRASAQDLFVHLSECASCPSSTFPPTSDNSLSDKTGIYVAIGAAVCAAAVAVVLVWRRTGQDV